MLLKGFSLLFLSVGVFVLVQIVMPYLAFEYWALSNLDRSTLVDPLAALNRPSGDVLGVSIKTVDNFPAIIFEGEKKEPPYREFTLEIPSIKLSSTQVVVNSNVFEENLAHLPGTVLPGEKGNIFVTGHSSITANAQFPNKKAFFANLPKIKKGDEIIVNALNQKFTYQVQGLKVVDPTDVSVILPPDPEGRYLTVMTCVPPGFNTKRLVVIAKLKS